MNTQHFDAIQGADVYRMSNPCVLAVISLLGSLQLFDQTSMDGLVAKSRLMTGYLEWLLSQAFPGVREQKPSAPFQIMTPGDPQRRGCQLSLLFNGPVKPVFEYLVKAGVVCDKREPNSLRLAPVPLYNSFEDCWRFVECLKQAMKQ
jgi:kynureninase